MKIEGLTIYGFKPISTSIQSKTFNLLGIQVNKISLAFKNDGVDKFSGFLHIGREEAVSLIEMLNSAFELTTQSNKDR